MANEPESGTEVDEIQRDWAAETTDTLVGVVDTVKAATTTRIQGVVKIVVYGMLALFLGLMLVFLLLLGLFRAAVAYLPPSDSSWSAWLAFGVVFTAVGAVLWVKRGRLLPPEA
ncbi:MAG: hypothetical protein AAGA99_23200 [Actinomycetota bacterium]